MKRFYKVVQVVEAEAGGFSIALDGRPVKTPGRKELLVPMRDLAEAICAEWDVQTGEVDPGKMPMMRFAATAIDRVALHRDAVIDEISGFGASDLLCHRAERPADLVARQKTTWQPLLDWAEAELGAGFVVTAGVMPVVQPQSALTAVRAAIAGRSDLTLSGLHGVTSATGSVVIGLAVAGGHLEAPAAWEASQIDEAFQVERWGEDEEVAERRARLRAELADAVRFLRLCES